MKTTHLTYRIERSHSKSENFLIFFYKKNENSIVKVRIDTFMY